MSVGLRNADVLMSVYGRERADNLDASLNSLFTQTWPADRVVLVEDGPLGEALDKVVAKYRDRYGDQLLSVKCEDKPGLVGALNRGLAYCQGEYLLRADSDDIAVIDRFEKQLAYLERHPEIGVVSSALYEFTDDPRQFTRIKEATVTHDEIARQFPWRNPINQPAACLRTQILRDQGGYPDMVLLEDYMLWAQLLVAGVKFYNFPEPLQYYRFNAGNISRRGGYRNFVNECRIRWFLYRHGKASLLVTLCAMIAQSLLRLSPAGFRGWLWRLSRRQRN